MFWAHVLIVRRAKLYYTASGIITRTGVMIPDLVSHLPWVLLWPLYNLLCRCRIECVWFAASAVDCQIYALTVESFIWGSDEHWTSRPVRETKWYEKCVSVIHIWSVRQGFQNRWREKFPGKKWLQIDEVVGFKKLMRCFKTTHLMQLTVTTSRVVHLD